MNADEKMLYQKWSFDGSEMIFYTEYILKSILENDESLLQSGL